MSHRIDERPASGLGLIGQNAELPAFQIVNDANDLFLLLASRLVGLEYGSDGEAFRSHSLWPTIVTEMFDLSAQISALGDDAIRATSLSGNIRRLNKTVDGLVAEVNGGGHRA